MTSNANLIKLFNSFNYKRIIRINELDENKEYIINDAYRTQTKYGDRIVLKLEDAILYLPPRFLTLKDDNVKELGSGGYSISKLSLSDKENNLYRLQLKQSESNFVYQPYLTQ